MFHDNDAVWIEPGCNGEIKSRSWTCCYSSTALLYLFEEEVDGKLAITKIEVSYSVPTFPVITNRLLQQLMQLVNQCLVLYMNLQCKKRNPCPNKLTIHISRQIVSINKLQKKNSTTSFFWPSHKLGRRLFLQLSYISSPQSNMFPIQIM